MNSRLQGEGGQFALTSLDYIVASSDLVQVSHQTLKSCYFFIKVCYNRILAQSIHSKKRLTIQNWNEFNTIYPDIFVLLGLTNTSLREHKEITTLWKGVSRRQVPVNSEFTQQDGRKKRTAKRLCVTNVIGLLLGSFVVVFPYHWCFLVYYKKVCLKEGVVWWNVFSNKIIVTFVTQGLPSSFLSRLVA